MDPADYDAWYDTPRGHWIGQAEFRLALRLLGARPGQSLLDAGCGSGWFARAFAATGMAVTGLDLDPRSLAYARSRGSPGMEWVAGDARHLPFVDRGFDHTLSIAALCFIEDEKRALGEIVRVTRQRFVIGWLNRASLLYRAKAGQGAYRGARWRTASEIRTLFDGLPVRNLLIRSAIFWPRGGWPAPFVEALLPSTLNHGAILLATGEPRW